MPSRAEITRALYGAWRLALLDRSALSHFDLSHRGVWRSFWAALICYPGFLVLMLLRVNADALERSGLMQITLVETIGYIVAWCAFPLAVLGFTRWIGREEQGFDFIVAYNWSQALQILLLLIVGIVLIRLLPAELQPELDLTAYIAILAYEWFIALIVIGAGGWVAAAIVFMDVVLGSTIVLISSSLY